MDVGFREGEVRGDRARVCYAERDATAERDEVGGVDGRGDVRPGVDDAVEHLESTETPRHLEVHLSEGVGLQAEVLDLDAGGGVAVGGDRVDGPEVLRAGGVADAGEHAPLRLQATREGQDGTLGAPVEVPSRQARGAHARGGGRASTPRDRRARTKTWDLPRNARRASATDADARTASPTEQHNIAERTPRETRDGDYARDQRASRPATTRRMKARGLFTRSTARS